MLAFSCTSYTCVSSPGGGGLQAETQRLAGQHSAQVGQGPLSGGDSPRHEVPVTAQEIQIVSMEDDLVVVSEKEFSRHISGLVYCNFTESDELAAWLNPWTYTILALTGNSQTHLCTSHME